MGLFKKKTDPISDRSKALSDQIAALESQIKKLDSQLQQKPEGPRETKVLAAPAPKKTPPQPRPVQKPLREPIFVQVDQARLDPLSEERVSADHYNELGVRKYDLAGAWHRLRNQFRAPPANTPKLVTYLAAGSIKGLRPLRYEKRVARNRFLALLVILLGLVWGIIAVYVHAYR